MLTSGFNPELVPVHVTVDDKVLRVTFKSGLEVATPVTRFPRLQNATPEQRQKWRLIGRGDGLHWPEIDEDISVAGLFRGTELPVSRIDEVPKLIGDLLRTTGRLNHLFANRPFTPDGHLVGSIGEVVAEYVYDLELEPCSTPGIDAHTKEAKRRSVQIKLTGERGTSYGVRWSNTTPSVAPDLLICLKLTSEGFREVYNGPFPLHLLQNRKDQKNGQLSLSVSRLEQANPSTLAARHSFDTINRWFTSQRPQVA